VRENSILWREMWTNAVFDDSLRAAVEESYASWLEQVQDAIRDAIAEGSAATDDVEGAAHRLAAIVDGLSARLALGMVTGPKATEVVRDALAVELARNGHTLVPAGGDVVVTTDVEEFWLDGVHSGGGTLYVGRVAIALSVSDATTGARLFTRRYVGIKRQAGEDDSKTVRREVMDVALARAVRDVVTDPELLTAFAPRRPLARAAWRPLP